MAKSPNICVCCADSKETQGAAKGETSLHSFPSANPELPSS